MTSVLGQMTPQRCKQNCEKKWWLYINMKINHAVVHILNGFEWLRDSTITPVQLPSLNKHWDHLRNSLTVGFTKHNYMSAAFTTLELDSISTELTTVRQAQNKPTYLYNYGGVSSLNRIYSKCVDVTCFLDGASWIYNVHSYSITAVSLRWCNRTIIKFREMYMWLVVGWNNDEHLIFLF